jgi:hypothetical protein
MSLGGSWPCAKAQESLWASHFRFPVQTYPYCLPLWPPVQIQQLGCFRTLAQKRACTLADIVETTPPALGLWQLSAILFCWKLTAS